MKIKLDENLPTRTASALKTAGHDVQTVREEGLSGCFDLNLWETAQREKRFLITQDLDFSDVRRFAPGTHHGILLVRLRSPSGDILVERVEQLFLKENVGQWSGCFVVATEHKVRVRRPPSK
jgi:predicted nuclease of predicted toxin-antitoxin system